MDTHIVAVEKNYQQDRKREEYSVEDYFCGTGGIFHLKGEANVE